MSDPTADLLKQANDGTPEPSPTVLKSYRKLQVRTAIYEDPPPAGAGIRLAIYQAQAACGPDAVAANLQRLEQAAATAKKYGAQLLSFPELYLPGYALDPDTARQVSEPLDGPSITRARELAADHQMGMLVPYGESAQAPDGRPACFDSIAVIDEHGTLLDSYQKTHLYGQQERDNWTPGDREPQTYVIHGFPVGVLNCYECEFPELVRLLALKGAKLVVGPTAADSYYRMPNGQRSKVPYPDVSKIQFPAHAYANNLFFAYANRCGYETRDGDVWHYRGNSIVYGPHGDPIVAAGHEQDTLLVADCVPAYYGPTHPAPNYYYLKDRRPELYGKLTDPHAAFVDTAGGSLTESTNLREGAYDY